MTVSLEELRALRCDLDAAWPRMVDDIGTWARYDARHLPSNPHPHRDDWFGAFVRAAAVTGEHDPRRMGAALDAAITRAEAEEQAAAVAKASAGDVPELLRQILEVIRRPDLLSTRGRSAGEE